MSSTAFSPRTAATPVPQDAASGGAHVRAVATPEVPAAAGENTRVWLLFARDGSEKRAVAVTPHSPRRGRRVPVQVAASALVQQQVFLLVRKHPGDLVVAAAAAGGPLEELRLSLGRSADQYEVRPVPVVED